MNQASRKNVAIIGSGISGLTAAYLISQKHQVTVFEQNDYIGGHTATKEIEYQGEKHAIDTGFIVFNDRTYPNFLKLLSKLGVGKQPTEMSFSVTNHFNGLEYNGNNLNSLFAQRRNILNPKFWCLLKQIVRFNKQCKRLYAGLDEGSELPLDHTLGEFLQDNHFSDYFKQNYILPMGAAIWSTSLVKMEAFPLRFFVQFFYNHGLLNIQDRPQWYVIPGGSYQYIQPLIQGFKDNIKLNAGIKSVRRNFDKNEQGVEIVFNSGEVQHFDEVVLACHSDQALALLEDATVAEQQVLSDIPYSANQVVLHTDTSLLPERKLAWASWNYQIGLSSIESEFNRPACVTYNMNILQGLKSKHTFCVTLNQTEQIDPNKIIQQFVYHHPVFNQTSIAAQARRSEICGQNHTHFAGAYWFNGFHEDGVKSALAVAERFGVSL
ncbi:NAD(P)/FAD-dependent oxidoreductase [Catenovulum agarivorans]|uniref:NAD(P)/FAD-dependent oxidoreductase n=1 Tax=Catenovulum agarivorans TaxID=1172192 RepID=UPI0002E22A9F|nr:FAD-dependent oxidoreductase [Catenovulum agarivorans]